MVFENTQFWLNVEMYNKRNESIVTTNPIQITIKGRPVFGRQATRQVPRIIDVHPRNPVDAASIWIHGIGFTPTTAVILDSQYSTENVQVKLELEPAEGKWNAELIKCTMPAKSDDATIEPCLRRKIIITNGGVHIDVSFTLEPAPQLDPPKNNTVKKRQLARR